MPVTADAAYYADDGWVDGAAMARALLERARRSGAKVLLQTAAKHVVIPAVSRLGDPNGLTATD